MAGGSTESSSSSSSSSTDWLAGDSWESRISFLWGSLMRILPQWWRTRPKTGRSSTSKLWWVSDEVTDLGLSRVEGFHGCLFDWRTGAAGACSAVSWTRIAGECAALVSNISIQNQKRYLFFFLLKYEERISVSLPPVICSVTRCSPVIHLDPQVLHHSQPLPAPTLLINPNQFRCHQTT